MQKKEIDYRFKGYVAMDKNAQKEKGNNKLIDSFTEKKEGTINLDRFVSLTFYLF